MEQSIDCFFLKEDFTKFLNETKEEYIDPQQNYIQMENRRKILSDIKSELTSINKDKLKFTAYRVGVKPPRVYINSISHYYTLMRKLGLPNMSYLSVMKLRNGNSISYYFKMFVNYRYDVEKEYVTQNEKKEIEKINKSSQKSDKQRKAMIDARVGQGKYREKLLEECMYCPFTQVNDERILIASHIKPWSKSNDREKTDPKNGFIFTPTFDSLFDKGFITFSDEKMLIVSNWLSPLNQKRLQIYTGKKLNLLPLDEKRIKYLEYHREHIFKK